MSSNGSNFTVEGCVAVVTGAGRGLGKAIVDALGRRGAARIYAGVRDVAAARARFAQDDRIQPILLDVTSDESVVTAARQCQDTTLLVNNAGLVTHARFIGPSSLQDARDEMEVNYWGILRNCRAFAPALKANGGGAIANILSIGALANIALAGSYCASKAAAFSLTEGVAADLLDQGTTVMGVFAGPILTDMARAAEGRHPPELIATNILDALEAGQWWLFPDPTSQAFAERYTTSSWRSWLAPRRQNEF